MPSCLVLGGNGFLGSHLVDDLVKSGNKVRVFDKFSSTSEIRFKPNEKIEVVSGDFVNRADLSNALKGIDYVFHFISTTTPASAENDPTVDIETNIKMSVELFNESVAANVKKIIFPSTGGAIYGNVITDKVTEETNPKPISPYAIGKLTIEHYLRYFKYKHNLNSVIYRMSNVYGERQSLVNRQGVIPIFLYQIKNGEPITVLGDGSMTRDYIYVGDVVRMIVSSYQQTTKPVYNLGSGTGISLIELINIIKKVTNKKIKIKHLPKPSTFVERVVLNTDLFTKEFGIKPAVSLEAGIKKTWEYINEHPQNDK